jgi:hypothetical protein
MSKQWTRNQKTALSGVIVAAFVGYLGKMNDEVNMLGLEVDKLKAKAANIDSLESKVADIERIQSQSASLGTIRTTGVVNNSIYTNCPDRKKGEKYINDEGRWVVCM